MKDSAIESGSSRPFPETTGLQEKSSNMSLVQGKTQQEIGRIDTSTIHATKCFKHHKIFNLQLQILPFDLRESQLKYWNKVSF